LVHLLLLASNPTPSFAARYPIPPTPIYPITSFSVSGQRRPGRRVRCWFWLHAPTISALCLSCFPFVHSRVLFCLEHRVYLPLYPPPGVFAHYQVYETQQHQL